MSILFSGASRDELRRMYVEAWRKHRQSLPLQPLEAMIVDVIAMHPEYQSLLEDPEAVLGRDSTDAAERHNPFLHLGLHMALREQLSIDQPPGVRGVHSRVAARLGDAHAAEHRMLEVLAQVLWDAQRAGIAPDPARYLERLRQLAADS